MYNLVILIQRLACKAKISALKKTMLQKMCHWCPTQWLANWTFPGLPLGGTACELSTISCCNWSVSLVIIQLVWCVTVHGLTSWNGLVTDEHMMLDCESGLMSAPDEAWGGMTGFSCNRRTHTHSCWNSHQQICPNWPRQKTQLVHVLQMILL